MSLPKSYTSAKLDTLPKEWRELAEKAIRDKFDLPIEAEPIDRSKQAHRSPSMEVWHVTFTISGGSYQGLNQLGSYVPNIAPTLILNVLPVNIDPNSVASAYQKIYRKQQEMQYAYPGSSVTYVINRSPGW